MLHGFPTWSYDYAGVAADLETDFEVLTLDFLGYGASDKPHPYDYSVDESADIVEELAFQLDFSDVHLVVHDYGGIVGQELLDRLRNDKLRFSIRTLTVLNCGIVYSAYKPTLLQKLLIKPVIGPLLARRVTAASVRSNLDKIRGEAKLTDSEFDELWLGVSRDGGHKLAHSLIQYNAERNEHHARWEEALREWSGPLHLVWGLDDPVSGRHVLDEARKTLQAKITTLADVGHFPQAEAPDAVAQAVRSTIRP